ncbi:MAG TPA: PilZ domain-containing protein [Polyangiaceae bacterium]|nr:PilZ domain-containing protein [Polyangiaceae bacterium]
MNAMLETPQVRDIRRTARIQCQVVRLRDFSLVADRILDISEHGMLVGPADPVLTGEEVMISFQAPGLLDYIDMEAVVARIVHGRRPGETRRELGLEISYADRFTRRLLSAFSRRMPPVPPRFRPGMWRGKRRGPAFSALAPLLVA